MGENDTSERLVRIETKLDVLLFADSDKEKRIRVLEQRNSYMLGACAIIAFVVPIIMKRFGI